MKVLTERPADLACEVRERGRVDELEVHCHLRFAMSGTEQLTIIHSVFRCSFAYKMLQLQNCLNS